MDIPVNLNEEAQPLVPQAVYELACEEVTVLDKDGQPAADGDEVDQINLRIKIMSDDPSTKDCKKTIFHRLGIPNESDDGDMKGLKLYLLKAACVGFGVSYGDEGFDPMEFRGKMGKALIIQKGASDGRMFNNIKKFV